MVDRNLGVTRRPRPARAAGEVPVEGRRPPPWPLRLMLAVAIVSPLFSLWWEAEQKARTEIEQAGEWSLDGEPCPASTAADFAAASRRAPMTTVFDEVRLSRRAGHVQCARHAYRLGGGKQEAQVCDFTSPGALAVETPRTVVYYTAPGSARVAVIDGRPRCVQTARFRMGH